MRYAQTTKQVTFNEAISLVRGIPRSRLAMGYSYINDSEKKVVMRSTRVSAIYRDWYGECDYCPSNDAVVTHLHILLPTQVALDVIGEVPFGNLMDAIEAVTIGRKHCDA